MRIVRDVSAMCAISTSRRRRCVQFLFLLLWLALQATLLDGCPPECTCSRSMVDCSGQQLSRIPAGIAHSTYQLDISNNKVTEIRREDFKGLSRLTSLNLSENSLRMLEQKTFSHLPTLRILRLKSNQISCIETGAFDGLYYLETLDITDNVLTTLAEPVVRPLRNLLHLKLSGNQLVCDCQLSWLSDWLSQLSGRSAHVQPLQGRRQEEAGGGVRCSSPLRLQGRRVIDVRHSEFKCSGLEHYPSAGCSRSSRCPRLCKCSEQVVDCRDRGLKKLPDLLPADVQELRLEQNQITEIPSAMFKPYKRLGRIDISNNRIKTIAVDAFQGLTELKSLILYNNMIEEIPDDLFKGLNSLQLLLLNANKIQCVGKQSFSHLRSLTLLSLFDNQISNLPNDTFNNLVNIDTLHLGRNPFVCDCNLIWLVGYLGDRQVETSGVRCAEPRNLRRKKLSTLESERLQCTRDTLRYYQSCFKHVCPQACTCTGHRVDCSGQMLTRIPSNIPPDTRELTLRNNRISSFEPSSLATLTDLNKLDLSDNLIEKIKSDSFSTLNRLEVLILGDNRLQQIPVNLTDNLPDLRVLSLNNNRLTCLSKRTFQHLLSLETLNIQSNPLHCSCGLAPLLDWLRSRVRTENLQIGAPFCRTPRHLHYTPLEKLSSLDLKCPKDVGSECGDVDMRPCPKDCSCTENVIRCNRAGLEKFPKISTAASDVTEIYMGFNELAFISRDSLDHLISLRRLDLSNNRIVMLQNDTFNNLARLETLIISYNNLQCIGAGAFTGLESLRILSLHGNQLTHISEGTFTPLVSLTHIALGANPLVCDCETRWLSEWVKRDFREPGIARCVEPAALANKLLLTSKPGEFVCTGDEESRSSRKCDQCFSQPCRNGGTCHAPQDSSEHYTCSCTPGYYGNECQKRINACYGTPCANGGKCRVVQEGRFSCECAPGYTGVRCSVNIDDCLDNRCSSLSTCVDGINEYTCACPVGFTGQYCQNRIEYCSTFNPCLNGATCNNKITDYTCTCPAGLAGKNCTRTMDHCSKHLCQNGATCVGSEDGYTCRCGPGYEGRFCEVAPSISLMQQTSPCQQNECQHGVCFLPKHSSDYQCRCHEGYSGKYCEHLTGLQLDHRNAYVELEPPHSSARSNVTLLVRSAQENGILFYRGSREHLAVELFRGRLRVTYDLGDQPGSTMFSYEVLSDSELHTIELLVDGFNFTLRVDGGFARSLLNQGSRESLDSEQSIFIGGLPLDKAQFAVRNWHIRNTTSFSGCLLGVFIDGKWVDFQRAKHQNHVKAGCNVDFEKLPKESPVMKQLDLCANNQCKKGRCIQQRKKQSYRCKCKLGWSGKFCTIAPQCGRQLRRVFLVEGGCRSRRRMLQTTCVGNCGRDCCRPRGHRPGRRVTFICNDGTRYKKTVQMARKCRCQRKCPAEPSGLGF